MTKHQGIGMTSQRTRTRLLTRLKEQGIKHPKVLQAINEIPRHLFVDEALSHRAYEDTALPIGFGQTISQPYVVAQMTELLLENPNLNKVLEIGTGSGYQAAILSKLVDTVYTVERIKPLYKRVKTLLAELRIHHIELHFEDGNLGLREKAPFDGIIVTAASEYIPEALLAELNPHGGVLVIPVGNQEEQVMTKVERCKNNYKTTTFKQVRFVPLLGGKA